MNEIEQPLLETALLDSIPGGWALLVRRDSREIVCYNTVARQLGAACGKTCFETCMGRDTPCPFCLAPELWATGERQQIEVEYMDRWYTGVWAPLNDELYVHYLIEITERKRLEEQLSASERQLSSIYSAVDDAIFELAVGPDTRYRFVSINPAFCRLTGLSTEMVVGKYVEEVIPEPALTRVLERYRRAVDGESLVQWEEASDYPTGRLIGDVTIAPVFDEEGRCTHLVGSVHDVTEQRCSEEQLRLTQFSIDHAVDSVFWSDRSGRLLDVSDSTCTRLGYSREELLTMSLFDLDPTLSPERYEADWNLIQQQGTHALETVHRARDGSVFPVEVNLNFLEYGDQTYNCVFARDITDRKRAEATLRDREEQLRQAQKMEAIGQLAGGIAHDFNNLLTAIIGYSELALANNDIRLRGLSVRGDIEQIRSAADRASTLTKQILAFSRRQALRPEVSSLNAVLIGIEPLLRRTLGEDIDLITELHPDLGLAEIDVHQFEQVLMNLAVNARDAMPIGGRLTIETGNVELEEEYCRSRTDCSPGRHVVLSVSDTGLGMDEATRSRVFEPFFTTKPPGLGTGLGLSTVYGIVRQSGGSVTVDSEPGRGTAFKVYLPRVDRAAAEPSRTATAPLAPSGGRETVLLVEDEDALRTLAARVLGSAGYRVLSAANANEALELLAEGAAPDVLLTDVVLPGGLQGHDLARRLLAAYPDLPVLYMSGYTRNAIVHAGRLDEGVNYIEKPFTPDALTAMLRRVIDEAQLPGSFSNDR